MRVLPELQARPKIGGVEPSHIFGKTVRSPIGSGMTYSNSIKFFRSIIAIDNLGLSCH